MADRLSAKALREQRAPLVRRMRELADLLHAEKRDFQGEEKANWDKLNGDYDALSAQIERHERLEKLEAEQEERIGDRRVGRDDWDSHDGGDPRRGRRDERAGRGRDEDLLLQGWLRTQSDLPLSKRQKEAFQRAGLNPRRRTIPIALTRDYAGYRRERRDASASIGPSGGYLVAPTFMGRLEEALLTAGPMRQVGDVIRTDTGAEMPWPTVNDTSNEGGIVGENDAVSEQDVTFGRLVMNAWKYSSRLVQVPVELLEDAAFPVASWLGGVLGERIGRRQNRDFTVGTGASQARGIVNMATLGKTAASATAIAADELFDLLHSVDPLYRMNAGWMLHDAVLLVVRKLKDSQNRYLWESSLQPGVPDSLLGKPVYVNNHMASSVATTAKTILFGDFSKFKIRDVGSMRMRRLVERYADSDQEGFVGFLRSDGGLLDAGTNPVKYLQQA